jgi:putative oxidoreductase
LLGYDETHRFVSSKEGQKVSLRQLVAVKRSWKMNDWALLIFRVMVSLSLFIHHGWEKLSGFSSMSQHFMDPLHIGVVPSLLYAAFADGICALLVIVGLATRAASFFILVNLAVVYFIVHNALGLGFLNAAPAAMPGGAPGGMPPMPAGGGDHVELVFVYLASYILLTLAGGGAFSLDRWIGGKSVPNGQE